MKRFFGGVCLTSSALLLGACAQVSQKEASPDSLEVKGKAPVEVSATAVAPVDKKYTWDLTDLYPSDQAWDSKRKSLLKDIAQLSKHKGKLGNSSADLLKASDQISTVYKNVMRVLVYATLKADVDTRDANNEEKRQLARALISEFRSAISWYNPEVLSIGEKTIKQFVANEPGLKKHEFNLQNILRKAPHTLDLKAEAIIAKAGKLTGSPGGIYGVLANANMPWPEITLANGEKLTLSQAGYKKGRQADNRDDRLQTFQSFWGTWKDYEATLGNIMNSHIQGLDFETDVRGYSSSLARSLVEEDMPEAVYNTLIQEVNAALPTLHRYFKLRKRMLNIEGDMGYHDIYPSMVEFDKEFTLEESIRLTRVAVDPLGEEYLAAYDKGVEGRWMHVFPQQGKRSGAYMFGSAYDVHPYVFLNHNNSFDSASTFAHEYGHAVHTMLTSQTQPWESSDYATFIAETAAIINEMLLQDLVVSEAQSDQEKLFYLGQGLESLRGTFFRQTMFAEFELKMNEEVAAGNVLTGAKLTSIYLDLLQVTWSHY